MSGVGKFLANIFLMLLSLQRLPKVKSFKEMNNKTYKIPKLNLVWTHFLTLHYFKLLQLSYLPLKLLINLMVSAI